VLYLIINGMNGGHYFSHFGLIDRPIGKICGDRLNQSLLIIQNRCPEFFQVVYSLFYRRHGIPSEGCSLLAEDLIHVLNLLIAIVYLNNFSYHFSILQAS